VVVNLIVRLNLFLKKRNKKPRKTPGFPAKQQILKEISTAQKEKRKKENVPKNN